MKYASVCSGVEAASLAWMPLGWEAAWFSEIEPFPCAVLKERFPNVPNLGDMTKIKVENLENGDQRFTNGNGADVVVPRGVDLLVGGTPCQGFSVAGKQGGLEDDRSVLCLTFCQLLADMRPKWFVWENVPGVFSTAGGEDFKAFIREIDEVGYHVAWRVLDAQYVRVDGYPRAVPQRRRRVFVVGHLDGWEYPAEVLFEPHSLFGNTPPRRVKGKGFTTDFERSVGTASRPWDSSGVNPTLNQANAGSGTIGASNQELFAQNFNGLEQETFASSSHGSYAAAAGTLKSSGGDIGGGSENLTTFWNGENVSTTLTEAFADDRMPDKGKLPCIVEKHDQQAVMCLNDQGGSVMQVEQDGNAGTLRANTHGNEQIVCVHGAESPISNTEGYGNPVTANHNGLENCVCQKTAAFMGGQGAKAGGIVYSDEFSPTLKSDAGGNTVPDVVCWAAGGFGQKIKSDTAATISTDHDDRVTGNNAALIQECSYPSQHHAPKHSETVTLTTDNCATIRGDSPLVQECYSVDRRNQTLTEDDAVPCDVCRMKPDVYGRLGGEYTVACDHCIAKDTITAASEHEAVRLWNEHNTRSSSAVAIGENIIGRQSQNGGNYTGWTEELAYTQNTSGVMGVASHATVRRLLPIECERLMAFPDNWTRIPWKGKSADECPDSPRYKACGNSMCVNVMRWIGMRIEMVERTINR